MAFVRGVRRRFNQCPFVLCRYSCTSPRLPIFRITLRLGTGWNGQGTRVHNSVERSVVATRPDNHQMRSRGTHIPSPDTPVLRGHAIHREIATPENGVPHFGAKIVILGGKHALGRKNQIDHVLEVQAMESYYPRDLPRHSLRADQMHFESNLAACRESGAGGPRAHQVEAATFFPKLLAQTYGGERLEAVLSGIASSARSRYVGGWGRWVRFVGWRRISPWISRADANCDDLATDFIAPEANVMGNSAPTIMCKIPPLRFRLVVSGYPDFKFTIE